MSEYTCRPIIANLLHQIFTTTSRYERHLVIVRHNSKFATVHSRVTVGGCSMEFRVQFSTSVCSRHCTQNAIYQCSIYLYVKIPVHHSLFLKLLGTYLFFEYPRDFQPLPLGSIARKKTKQHFVWPCGELLWLCLSHKQHLVPPTVIVN